MLMTALPNLPSPSPQRHVGAGRGNNSGAASSEGVYMRDMLRDIIAVVLFLVGTWVIWINRRPKSLPPGPPAGLMGSHTHLIPKTEPWKKFYEWHQMYGPVISFTFGPQNVISLGSAKAAWDLLEKRGDIYSSRPRSIVAGEILSDGNRGIFTPYNQRWRNWRSLMQAGMNPTASSAYRERQASESAVMLKEMLEKPEGHKDIIKRYATSVVFAIAYGRRVRSLDDEIVVRNSATENYAGKIVLPGKFLVDSWPILLWIPKSLQWFRWDAEVHRKMDTELYMDLMNTVKSQIDQGIAKDSMATRALSKQAQFGLNEEQTAYALAAPYAAGVGTTTTAADILLMAMLNYPECMKKAQEELDRVVGPHRLPDFSDEDALPYCTACIKEAQRWYTLAPTGFPHAVLQDDVYEGMFIPKGTTIYSNLYAIFQDSEMFPEPHVYRPERFLENDDPRFINFTLQFGFGRRICPGMHVASASLFLVFTRMLWSFNILPKKDELGRPIIPDPSVGQTQLVRAPLPFGVVLEPRNKEVSEVIAREAEAAEESLKDWL
ncbi:hypothetical protein EIP91_010003 [Steccherinum ochraceum]|uniref:Cytochrome P450 n=1 Tax=Steccherinum ochraceum TaxID=92696 RepID=A0A4R0RT50_9APHY|nr:hypothetical protein EIP91_010003 [Steccherinum ochraceum]